jgi:hypothetical protein
MKPNIMSGTTEYNCKEVDKGMTVKVRWLVQKVTILHTGCIYEYKILTINNNYLSKRH